MEVRVTEFREVLGKTLQGFITVEFPEVGLRLSDIAYHKSDRKEWCQLPTKPFNKPGGGKGWQHIVDFTSKDLYQQFQFSALEAIDVFFGESGGYHASDKN